MTEREEMTTKILNTLEGDYITVKGLRSGRLIEHEVYQEPAVEAWRAALEEAKTYGTKFGHAGTPNRKG